MSEDPTLFDIADGTVYDEFLDKMQKRCEEIVACRRLPKNSIIMKKREGKDVTSISVCVNEPPYPILPVDEGKEFNAKPFVYTRIPQAKNQFGVLEIHIAPYEHNRIPPPSNAEVSFKQVKDIGPYVDVRLSLTDPALYDYLVALVNLHIDNYVTSQPAFGCCDMFEKCSDAKRCLHSNLLYSTACAYRRNLESGRVFYGKNKNV